MWRGWQDLPQPLRCTVSKYYWALSSPYVRQPGFRNQRNYWWIWSPGNFACGSQNPEYIQLVESGIVLTIGIRNPRFHWQSIQNPLTGIRSPQSTVRSPESKLRLSCIPLHGAIDLVPALMIGYTTPFKFLNAFRLESLRFCFHVNDIILLWICSLEWTVYESIRSWPCGWRSSSLLSRRRKG